MDILQWLLEHWLLVILGLFVLSVFWGMTAVQNRDDRRIRAAIKAQHPAGRGKIKYWIITERAGTTGETVVGYTYGMDQGTVRVWLVGGDYRDSSKP